MCQSLLPLAALTQLGAAETVEEPKLVEPFLVTGLHCPPCAITVESSVASPAGVHAIVVDWKTKAAKVSLDPAATAPWSIAERVASTRHMMGGRLKYAAWLGLSIPELHDEKAAVAIKRALKGAEGVAAVSAYLKQHIAAVLLDEKAEVTVDELIQTIQEAGYAAQLY